MGEELKRKYHVVGCFVGLWESFGSEKSVTLGENCEKKWRVYKAADRVSVPVCAKIVVNLLFCVNLC